MSSENIIFCYLLHFLNTQQHLELKKMMNLFIYLFRCVYLLLHREVCVCNYNTQSSTLLFFYVIYISPFTLAAQIEYKLN